MIFALCVAALFTSMCAASVTREGLRVRAHDGHAVHVKPRLSLSRPATATARAPVLVGASSASFLDVASVSDDVCSGVEHCQRGMRCQQYYEANGCTACPGDSPPGPAPGGVARGWRTSTIVLASVAGALLLGIGLWYVAGSMERHGHVRRARARGYRTLPFAGASAAQSKRVRHRRNRAHYNV